MRLDQVLGSGAEGGGGDGDEAEDGDEGDGGGEEEGGREEPDAEELPDGDVEGEVWGIVGCGRRVNRLFLFFLSFHLSLSPRFF